MNIVYKDSVMTTLSAKGKQTNLQLYPNILILDDDTLVLESLTFLLQSKNYCISASISAVNALKLLNEQQFDIIIVDMIMDEMYGIDFITKAKSIAPQIIPIIVTAYADKELAITAIKEGAFDIIEKPIEPEFLIKSIESAWQIIKTEKENKQLIQELKENNYRLHQEIIQKEHFQHALEASVKSFRNIVEKSVDGIIVLAPDGIVRFANQAALYLFSRGTNEILGKNIGIPLIQDQRTEVEIIRKNNEFGVGEIRIVETEWEDKKALLALIRDITERYELEEGLKAKSIELQQANNELKRTNNEIKSFTYIVSHDLKTPLTNIHGFSSLIKLAIDQIKPIIYPLIPETDKETHTLIHKQFETELPEFINYINSSVTRMNELIKAILILSRMGHRELSFDLINMNELVQNVLKSLEYKIKLDNIDIQIDELPIIYVDHLAMNQIMSNILTNAVNYSHPDRKGLIKIESKQLSNEFLFTIADNGIGIDEKDFDKVFAVFRRAGTKTVEGDGMGMAYVQTLVRRHNGNIWFESELGVGTTFYFTIANKPNLPKTLSKVNPIRILYMDDSQISAILFQKRMEKMGYDIKIANDGDIGIKMFENDHFDIIIVDYNMQNVNGLEVIKHFSGKNDMPPIIMVSGAHNDQLESQIKTLGALDFILKDIDDYYDKIDSLIKKTFSKAHS